MQLCFIRPFLRAPPQYTVMASQRRAVSKAYNQGSALLASWSKVDIRIAARTNGYGPWKQPTAMTLSQCIIHTHVLKSFHRCAVKSRPVSRMILTRGYSISTLNWRGHGTLYWERQNLLQDWTKECPVVAGASSKGWIMWISLQVHDQWLHVSSWKSALVGVYTLWESRNTTKRVLFLPQRLSLLAHHWM